MNPALMEETDEVFLQTLYRGSELIGQGDLEEARETLHAAVKMRPDDPKARNLLGLSCFKLGDYVAAESLYQELVHENPEDATLRVNLGLVHLKAGRFENAIRELAVAIELQPDHRRAQNYLGLAYARVGDYAQAQECFVAAGSTRMIERMERLMASDEDDDPDMVAAAPDTSGEEVSGDASGADLSGQVDPDAPSHEGVDASVDVSSAPIEDRGAGPADPVEEMQHPQEAVQEEDVGRGEEARDEHSVSAGPHEPTPSTEEPSTEDFGQAESCEPAEDLEGSAAPVEQAGDTLEPMVDGEDEEVVAEGQTRGRGEREQEAWLEDEHDGEHVEEPPVPTIDPERSGPQPSPDSRWVLPTRLLELADALALPARIPGSFAVSADVVVAAIEREILSRVTGLVAMDGHLELKPEVKRFRGRATEKPFGHGDRRVLRITGAGRLYFATKGRFFTPVRVDGADAYLAEESVFAFEETVAYENGRVPSKVSPDLNLVHLRGRGVILLETEGALVSTPVTPGEPFRVPLERLVGWTGLLTPRIVSFAEEGGVRGGPLTGVELVGEGRVLMALPEP